MNMLAVAFSEDSLVRAPDVERLAFARLCAEAAATVGAGRNDAAVERAYDRHAAALREGGDTLNLAIATAVNEAVGLDGSANVLAARYRQIGGAAAAQTGAPVPGAERAVRELEDLAIPQAVLANGVRTVEARKAELLGFTGKVLVSEDIGVRKPSLSAFSALARELALPSERIWYVGVDYERDIVPARAAGFNSVWLTDSDPDPNESDSLPLIRTPDGILELIKEPYTRSLLGMRYVMRTALEWRPGHFLSGDE